MELNREVREGAKGTKGRSDFLSVFSVLLCGLWGE
jgi:hypothetical protein